MSEEKRSNQGYEIIESRIIGSTELVIGHHPTAPIPMCVGTAKTARITSGVTTPMSFLPQGTKCVNAAKMQPVTCVKTARSRRKAVTSMSDKKKYDCTSCPYPRYKDSRVIYCDICIRRILDEHNEKKQGKEDDTNEQ